MQQQQKNQLNFRQRFQTAFQLVKIISRAQKQDAMAFQMEDALVKSFGLLGISEQSIQMFKDRFAKLKLRTDHARLEDIYVMEGILIYCGVLFPVLIGLGLPDFPIRFAWIAFAISFPRTIGFFLVCFLKEKNNLRYLPDNEMIGMSIHLF